MTHKNIRRLKVAALALLLTTLFAAVVSAQPSLFLNISTDKQIYYVGDTVQITGNVTLDGSPLTDALVAIQVNSPSQTPFVLRTVQTGPIQTANWKVNITEAYTCDVQGNPKESFILGSTAYYKIKWRNYSNDPQFVMIAIYIEYSNKAPCKAYFPFYEWTPPQTEQSLITSFEVFSNSPLGVTTLYASLLTQTPKEDGYPYCPEKNTTFLITSSLGGSWTLSSTVTPLSPPNFDMKFSLLYAEPGTYYIYGATAYNRDQVSNSLTFGVQPKTVPPVAYFEYSPMPAGVNMTITFDASGSLAQGYNDTIIRYEWRFGDGTPAVIKTTPTVTHVFTANATFMVSLNVTDNEGLWNSTSKSVDIHVYIPPKADFTWLPNLPYVTQIVTFDASISTLGWNGTGYPPIISYHWDFGDGYIANVTTPTVNHPYLLGGNFTVTLTIKDSEGQQSYKSKIITVYEQPPQGNGDVDGNGRVDMTDVIIVVTAFGSTPEKPNWDPRADIDNNGRVDMSDVVVVVSNFGKEY
ncbi:MAG: PKD domain-containing protein [Candidatus Bathyarchaeota archaeon]|jgi:hypothetical protein|nr:PKD domain-containing protein [Candidatus Bathyarchaeota archaeon A05DMB-5]MDH7557892.1 PKD domain-containing protein [Candidatus Bathyarchaeota archaeon]